MAFLDHNGESEFPMSKQRVFEAMQKAIPTIKGLTIENADKLQGRFVVKAGVSLYSWGENIPIQLSEISENRTKVQITSSPKTGIMFGGAFDMGKNRKNIENILSTTSMILSNMQNQSNKTTNEPSIYNQPNNFQATMPSNYMEQQKARSNAWYEKTWLVVILCIIFFPVGLYALWKSSKIGTGWKIVVTALIAFIVIVNLGDKKTDTTPTSISTESQNSTPTEQVTTQPTEADIQAEKANSAKQEVVEKLKARAKRDWPNDYTTQEFWVNAQTEAYEYMLTIENNSIKKQAQRDWPLDFTTQKFWYNQQIEAKERMK